MIRRLTALATLALAVALAGCGGGDEKTIPSNRAAVLIRHLQKARDAAGDPDKCDDLQRAVAAAQADVQSLPASVDGDTRQSLVDGVNNLQTNAEDECRNAQTTPTTTETTPPTTTETAPPTTTQTTPPTTTETTPPTTTETTPPKTTPGNGGATPGQGNGQGQGNGGGKGNGGSQGPANAPGQDKKDKGKKK